MLLEWNIIHTKRLDKNWDFSLLKTSWPCKTIYQLTTHHLNVQVTEGADNGNSMFAKIIPNNNEKPIKIGSTCRAIQENNENILMGFRGVVTGYPNMQFSIRFNSDVSEANNNPLISCDVIEILYSRINFYKFAPNGEVKLIKQITHNKCDFTIFGQELNGQILSKEMGGHLSPYDIVDFIYDCNTIHKNSSTYKREKVLGNITDDSIFNYLLFDIRKQYVYLTYTEILHQESYKIFNKDVECLDTTYRYLWAIYRFQSSYHLVKFINQITQIADIIQQDKENYSGDIEYIQMFKFKKGISKNEFELATGIHLFESIRTSEYRSG